MKKLGFFLLVVLSFALIFGCAKKSADEYYKKGFRYQIKEDYDLVRNKIIKEGFKVLGIDSDLYRYCTFGKKSINKIPEKIKDVRDIEKSDLMGIDAIIHLAGLSNDPLGDLNPDLTLLTGEEEILATPFASTVVKPIADYLGEFIVPVIYSSNDDNANGCYWLI